MKKIFICSPLSKGNIKINIARAVYYGRQAYKKGYLPIVPHAYTDIIAPKLKDNNKKDRKEIMKISLSLLSLCDEIWIYNPINNTLTNGMLKEISFAEKLGIKRWFITENY